ncbi:LITAF domain-containing protein-like [Babylonia areolata]|uniref:LITAF domain-containing protein-like n=1 Tax=Babylonia areolata TaxID=304850 RepID=UPI003FD13D5A
MSKVDSAYPPPPPAYQPPPPGYQPPPPGYQPPPPGYQPGPGVPGQQSSSTTVVVSQPGVYGPQPGSTAMYREVPCLIACQHCNATVTTTTAYSVGTATWLSCVIVCFVGFWLGCCLIPFCLDACKDVIHTCPNCRQNVGRYSRM